MKDFILSKSFPPVTANQQNWAYFDSLFFNNWVKWFKWVIKAVVPCWHVRKKSISKQFECFAVTQGNSYEKNVIPWNFWNYGFETAKLSLVHWPHRISRTKKEARPKLNHDSWMTHLKSYHFQQGKNRNYLLKCKEWMK